MYPLCGAGRASDRYRYLGGPSPARRAAEGAGAGADVAGGGRGYLRLPLLRHLQGRGTHHRPADRGPVRLGDAGYFRGGAGTASGDPGHYREKGYGDRRVVPSAHGLAAADGISLPVSAAAGAGHPAAAAVWGRGHPGGGEKSLSAVRRCMRRGFFRDGHHGAVHGICRGLHGAP